VTGAPTRTDRRDAVVAATAGAWLVLLLVLDAGASVDRQRLVGLATWVVLGTLIVGETRRTRAQVLAVIAVATLVEYTASEGLGVYRYRLENVPSFVPPGHGLVYLAALAATRLGPVRAHARPLIAVILAGGAAWALWGATVASRPDAFGAVLFLVLVAFVARGPSPLLYAGVFVVTTYLELAGTALGTWTWSEREPFGILTMGNPPSGIAAAYCVLDGVGVLAAPRLLAAGERLRRRYSRPGGISRAGGSNVRSTSSPRRQHGHVAAPDAAGGS
jgi:hypothetical protein